MEDLTIPVVAIRLRVKKHLEPPALGEYVVAGKDGYCLIGPFQTFAEADEWITQPGILEALTDEAEWETLTISVREAVDKWGQAATYGVRYEVIHGHDG